MRAKFLPFPLFLFLALNFSGCGVEENRGNSTTANPRWPTLPVLLRVEESLLNRGPEEEDLMAAVAFWEEKAGRKIFILGSWPTGRAAFEGSPDNPSQIIDNVLSFQRPWPFELRIAGKTVLLVDKAAIQKAVIFLNAQIGLCSGLCAGQENLTSRRRLIAHELGHFIGLNHVNDRENVMFPEILPGGSLENLKVELPLLNELTR